MSSRITTAADVQAEIALNNHAGKEAPASAPDPFDLSNLRLSQSFTETAGVKKLITTIPVRKPSAQDWVRVHPDPQMRDNFPLIELKDERGEEYVIAGSLVGELVGEFVSKTLYVCINRQGVLSLWPVRLPDPDGREMDWHRSAREAAERAMSRWVRVKSNRSLGAYEVFEAQGTLAEPGWPHLSFQEIVKIAFRDRLITTLDHPVIKRLRGLA
jgi:hypothetical protein